MEFFDKLGKKASEAYKMTADKTGKIAKETKMKFKIGELKSQINDIYEEIGKKVYEKHVKKEEISMKKDLEEQCTKIDVMSDEIEMLLKQCLELKDKKQCSKCFKEIEKDAKFCPNCGANQEEIEMKEDLIDNQIKIDEVTNQEEAQEKNNIEDNSTNLEKTVKIESNVEENIDDDNQ